ncbi:MAG: hypothetical protein CMJ40_09810 [Phycisphaerae bacterium]|nr:hypothetical protein [Phycisphaerae bacterium]|tara:strand:- start:2242 stop:2466 length:225 start_codon:yes stop_codon:yes gene_type:complete
MNKSDPISVLDSPRLTNLLLIALLLLMGYMAYGPVSVDESGRVTSNVINGDANPIPVKVINEPNVKVTNQVNTY